MVFPHSNGILMDLGAQFAIWLKNYEKIIFNKSYQFMVAMTAGPLQIPHDMNGML